MNRVSRQLLFGSMVLLVTIAAPSPAAPQQRLPQDEARSQWEVSCAIRKDKFRYGCDAAQRR